MDISNGGRIVVLDDDPTGVQTLSDVRVLFRWDATRVRAAFEGRSAVHLVTNTRAQAPGRVERQVNAAAQVAHAAIPEGQIVLRGDSTLRGHLLEEYLGLRNSLSPATWPALLLVPAFPAMGRITIGGKHFLEHNGVRTPLDETEFARDGVFAYRTSRLLDWAEERSSGFFQARIGRRISLDTLRAGGAGLVAKMLGEVSRCAAPAVFAPDAETDTDLETIAAGYRLAVRSGARILVRCSPAFAGVLAGTTARKLVPLPQQGIGAVVVCGSYVSQTGRQLARLAAAHPDLLIEADVSALAAGANAAQAESARLAAEASRRIRSDRIAVIATPRERRDATASLSSGELIASGLARAVKLLEGKVSLVVAKGGITSAVVLREGVGAEQAEVVGPVEPGVSRWKARWLGGSPLDYLVVPGNVGDEQQLLRVVNGIINTRMLCS